MLRRVLIVLALAPLPACSLLVKSDDLVGGTTLPAGNDAGGEAGMKVGTEAGADANGALDGGALCQGNTLCDDFEGAGTITWRPTMTGNASVVVDGVKPRSGMRSLHASRAAAAGREAAYYEYSPAGTLRFCELDVIATATTSDSVSVFNFGFGSVDAPFTGYSLSMQIGGGLAQFGPMGSSPALYTDVHVASLVFGRWLHVRLDFDWTPSASALVLTVDGVLQPRFPITPPKGTKPFVQMGGTYTSAVGQGWDVFVDNVMCASD